MRVEVAADKVGERLDWILSHPLGSRARAQRLIAAGQVTVDGEIKFACVDGPEFDGHKVDFRELATRQQAYCGDQHCRITDTTAQAGSEDDA